MAHSDRAGHVLLILLAAVLTALAGCSLQETLSLAETTTALPAATLSPEAATATTTATPEPSSTPTITHTPTTGPSGTPTPLPTATPIPSATPTSQPQLRPGAVFTGTGTIAEGVPTPPTVVPSPVPVFQVPSGTTNILLLGSDRPLSVGQDTRTDTMIIVSLNREGPTASMLSLPRDLYVYLPGRTMARLNTAILLGGVNLLKQTILYNFGLPIHYYARVDFAGFQRIVDAMGGVEMHVSCRLEDWRLISPELDPNVEENWHKFALEPGVYHMDGDTALWYARSRLSTDDFDRGRRQQQLLRSMFNQAGDLGLLAQVPTLWDTYRDNIETDMDIGRMLQIAALAPAVRENGIQHLYLAGRTRAWVVPDSGAQVQLPIWEGERMMQDTFFRLYQPPALNRAARAPIFVEVVNASGHPDMAALAADNLAWYGLIPVIAPTPDETVESTEVTLFAPNFKGSFDWLMGWLFDQRGDDVQLDSEREYEYEWRVVLGRDYDPCRNGLYAPA